MTNEQYKAMMLQLESIAHNTKLIADALHKLSRPPIPVDNVLSSQDLDSLAGLPPGFSTSHTPVKVERVGLRNQTPADDVRRIQLVLERTLGEINGHGLNCEDYKRLLLKKLQAAAPDMTMIQMESTVLAFTGNSIESHWSNQADV